MKCLQMTRSWGIKNCRPKDKCLNDLPDSHCQEPVPLPEAVGEFMADVSQPKLISFVDGSCGSEPQKLSLTPDGNCCVHKCFQNVKCKCKTVHWDHRQLLHTDCDQEQMWRNEVKIHLQSACTVKKIKKQQINQILAKLASTELDSDIHSPKIAITIVRAITAVKCGDATTPAASDEEI